MKRNIINSIWNRLNRNGINANFEYLFELRGLIEKVVIEDSLTPTEYAELTTLINGLLKSGEVKQDDLANDLNTFLNDLETNSESTLQEIESARGTHTVLAARLNGIDSQLADTEEFLDPRGVNAEYYGIQAGMGLDMSTIINNAIQAVSQRGGGVVFLPAGEFRISSPLRVLNNVTLKGAGMGATKIKLNGGANCNAVELVGDTWGNENYQSVQDLTLEGNYSVQTGGTSHGLYGEDSLTYTYVNNVKTTGFLNDGIRYVSAHRNIVTNSITNYNRGNGLTILSGTKEGTSSNTDNHLEMGYITSDSNEGHGFHFDTPIDNKVFNLTSTRNKLDGIYINHASGGWGNMFNTLMLMGNQRHGLHVFGGSDINIDNVAVTGSFEHNIKLDQVSRLSIDHVSSYDGGIGNFYAKGVNECQISGVIARHRSINDLLNIQLTSCSRNQFSDILAIGGKDGLLLDTGSSDNLFGNVTTKETKRHGIALKGDTVPNNRNSFDSVYLYRNSDVDYPNSSAFDIRQSQYTFITNFKNHGGGSYANNYGININSSPNCMVNMAFAQGTEGGVYVLSTNTTSKIGTEVIENTY